MARELKSKRARLSEEQTDTMGQIRSIQLIPSRIDKMGNQARTNGRQAMDQLKHPPPPASASPRSRGEIDGIARKRTLRHQN
jgi:hypothetical protein